MTDRLRRRLAEAAPGRASLRTRLLAAGIGGGSHRAERRGSGIEFAGHREYVPGDDLRHLDRHALLRHGRHLIREFHSETERALWLVVDASPSMYFRGEGGSESKLGYALLLAAALGLWARSSGDPLALTIIRRGGSATLPPRGGAAHFEHVMAELEQLDRSREESEVAVDFAAGLGEIGRRAPRASSIVVLSDLLDTEGAWQRELPALSTHRRKLVVGQLLDPAEVEFPFRGAVRLRDTEGAYTVETDAERVRSGYLEALARHTESLERTVFGSGGGFVRLRSDAPLDRSASRLRLSLVGHADATEEPRRS